PVSVPWWRASPDLSGRPVKLLIVKGNGTGTSYRYRGMAGFFQPRQGGILWPTAAASGAMGTSANLIWIKERAPLGATSGHQNQRRRMPSRWGKLQLASHFLPSAQKQSPWAASAKRASFTPSDGQRAAHPQERCSSPTVL